MIKLPIKTNSDKEFKLAIEWFENAFDSPPYKADTTYTYFTLGGYEIALYKEKNSFLERRRKNIVYVVVNDIATIFNRLISMGANVIQKPFVLGGEIMIARVKNPFGHILCLVDDPSYK
jgi:predicted enzyme related to lactoylglutathione lyase